MRTIPETARDFQLNKGRSLRIALYSHDTCGLGHMRRNLLIAETLVEQFPAANVLLITGAREVASFNFPNRVDAVSLPSLYKESNEVYAARSFQLHINELIRIRTSIIKTSIEAFDPDIFIVDKVPRGTMGELDDTLAFLASRQDTKCVLGLRDILDKPETTIAEWEAKGNTATVSRYYDQIWVYGDKCVFNHEEQYKLPSEVEEKLHYTGYLDPSIRLTKSRPNAEALTLLDELGAPFYLCAVGGGQDGAELALAFAHASFPKGVKGLIVTGPHMPADAKTRLQEVVTQKANLKLVSFLSEPLYIYQAAERIVSMGGYNTTLELLGLGASALLVPRVRPREEQWIRSEALKQLGLLDHLHPDLLSARAISQWMQHASSNTSAHELIDMRGLDRIPVMVEELHTPALPEQKNSPVAERHHALT